MLVLVTQSCLTICDPMDCSPPGSSVHEIFQARILEILGCHFLLQGIFPTQGLNPGLLHCRQILYQLSYKGSPKSPKAYAKFCLYAHFWRETAVDSEQRGCESSKVKNHWFQCQIKNNLSTEGAHVNRKGSNVHYLRRKITECYLFKTKRKYMLVRSFWALGSPLPSSSSLEEENELRSSCPKPQITEW